MKTISGADGAATMSKWSQNLYKSCHEGVGEKEERRKKEGEEEERGRKKGKRERETKRGEEQRREREGKVKQKVAQTPQKSCYLSCEFTT